MIKSTCPYCGVGCGVLVSADGRVEGDPDHPANFGRLCSKGSALGETIDLDGRLLTPQIGGRRAGWNDALDLVADKFSAAIKEHGPDSVAFYVSGQLLTEDYYVANKLMKGYIGSANIDTNSRLCMASSVVGHKRAFGTDTVPGIYEDFELADTIVLVGSNLAWCHPVLYQRILAAKEKNPAMRIVNIDPRRTASSEQALHLQIAPDGDTALFNGLLAYLADNGHLNADYINAYVNGAEAAIASARATDTAKTGLSSGELNVFYQLWAKSEKVVTIYSQGVNQSSAGSDKVNAILNCHLATGRIGREGMGPFSVTGQPNAMGGREVGGLANMLANHLDIENEDHRAAVQGFWDSPTICTAQGLKAVDLFEACASGQIKALWVMSTNPAVSMPSANGVASAIRNVPFTVVTDIMARTDTGDLANVLLPAAGWGEKTGTVTNSERRVSRQRAFLPIPGEARPDWKIISDVAARMGWAEDFAYESHADVFDEYVALSKAVSSFGKDLQMDVFEGQAFDDLEPTQWPENNKRFFSKGGFFHADGKAKMLPVEAPDIQERAGLRLNSGRARDQWHTMTRTGKSPRLGQHLAEPYLEIHPDDAAAKGVAAADLVKVSKGDHSVVLRALITDRVAQGNLFAPMHWTRQFTSSGWVNGVVDVGKDPFSGQPALKSAAVDVSKFDADIYGFVATIGAIEPFAEYSAITKTKSGWKAEFSGTGNGQDWASFAQRLTEAEGLKTTVFEDKNSQSTRVATARDGVIETVVFVSNAPVALSRDFVVTAIGTETSPMKALAGWPGADMPDPGATVCACMSVGVNTLRDAIKGGAHTVEALGVCTSAGTSCGSCKPELAALIAKSTQAIAAE